MPKLVTLPRGIFEKVPGSLDYWIRYADCEAKYHREHVGKLSAAKARLEDRRSERRKGILPLIAGGPRPKVEVAEEATFDDLVTTAKTHASAENDATHAHELSLKFKRMTAEFGKLPAAAITKDMLRDWLDKQAKKHDWSDSTWNRYHAAFSLVFRLAVESGKLLVNPAKGCRKRQESGGRVRFLSQDEEARLTAVLQERSPEYLPVFLLSMHSGMRLSEQLRAKVGDFDPTSGTLVINQKKVRNAPAVRYVPLTPIGIKAYNDLAEGKNPGDPLCTNLQDTPLTETRYWFDPAVEAAGITDYTWHCNRHCFASRAVMSGVPIAVVSKMLGHASITQTMVYSHLQPANSERMVAALMSYYQESKPTPTDTIGA